tara:strand:- start:6819 stop:7979 length:1161 start_codon:yes stop_codon:yes gene_type:complete
MIISFDRIDINYGSNWDKHYPNLPNENIIFWDEYHCDRLEPLEGDIPSGWNELYKILTSKFNQEYVYYVTSDFNIRWQIEKLKKLIIDRGETIETNIKFLIHPYTMCYDEFFRLNNGKILSVVDNILYNGTTYKKFNYKYNFISLNGTRKTHRVKLVKDIHNINRIVYSYYPFEDENQMESYYEYDDDERKYLRELTELNEIYDEVIFDKVLDKPLNEQSKEEIIDKMANKWEAFQQSVPLEYLQSCADLVTDAFFGDGLSFTEKTWKPVCHKKPYILMSSRNVHKALQVMGYELYDELFDYSFDDKDFDERYKSIVSQVKTLCELTVSDFAHEVSKLKPKIEYNYHHFCKERTKWGYLGDDIAKDETKFINFILENQFDESIFYK